MTLTPAASTSAASVATRVRLYVSHGRALVFDVNDIATLRAEHRVCGLLSGTLPHLAQQNVFLGPPLILTPEETVFVVNSGAAVLVDDPRAHAHAPTDAQLQAWVDERDRDVAAQHDAAAQQAKKHASEAEKKLSPEALAKRAARQALKARSGAATPIDPLLPGIDTLVPPAPNSSSSSAPQEQVHFVETPLTSASLPWHADGAQVATYDTLAAARQAGIWNYPSNALEQARCAVFSELSKRGYWMGGGIRFGGDFLVYPGDPLRYHSHFVATVHDPHSVLRPMDIVAHGRLGTGTRKAHLFCAWDERTNEVDFYSLEWSGFG